MRNLRKTSILFCTLILGLFTACNLGLINKTGQLYFDFSEFSTAKNKNSRTVLEDVIEEGKNYYIDLSIEGSYKFNTIIKYLFIILYLNLFYYTLMLFLIYSNYIIYEI